MSKFRTFIASLGWACIACSCVSPQLREPMTIPVTFNPWDAVMAPSNVGPLLVDTGASYSLVDDQLAKRLNLPKLNRTEHVGDVTGTYTEVEVATVPRLSIPTKNPDRPWELHNLGVFVVKGLRRSFGHSFILGMPAFKHRIVDLNLGESEIRFLSSLPSGPGCVQVPVKTAPSGGEGTPAVPVEIRGLKPFYGRLDTGYNGFLALNGRLWEQVPMHAGSRRTGASDGILNNMITERAVTSRTIHMGNLLYANCPVTKAKGQEWKHNLIGVQLLKLTRLAIDWDHKKAVFHVPRTYAAAVEASLRHHSGR